MWGGESTVTAAYICAYLMVYYAKKQFVTLPANIVTLNGRMTWISIQRMWNYGQKVKQCSIITRHFLVNGHNIQMFYIYGHISLTMFSLSDWRMRMQSLLGSLLSLRKPGYEARLHTSLVPRLLVGERKKEPDYHCWRMRLIMACPYPWHSMGVAK